MPLFLFIALLLTPRLCQTFKTQPLSPLLPSCSPNPSTFPRSANFSLYVLSLQWPFTVCTTAQTTSEACQTPPAAFTIRGLWPTAYQPGHSPTCCDTSFSLDPILDIAPPLIHFWPDLSPANDAVALWHRQWLLHGSCSGLALRTYFRKVLELSRRYDFLRALNAAGVVATSTKAHRSAILQKAVDGATGGYRVEMRCRHSGDKVFLEAVQVCLHKTRFQTIHCPDFCLDGDVDCCNQHDQIRIPYWSHRLPPDDGKPTPRAGRTSDSNGFWIGQVAGALVVAAGLGFWLFKQFWERDDRSRPNRLSYVRLW